MSFNPSTIPTQPFQGAPYSIPINLGSGGRVVPLQIIWLLYGVSQLTPSAGVTINLAQNQQTQLIGKIRGVYIDNTASDCSIYVYFPDTQQTIPCGPFSAVWSPVITSSWQFSVIGKGFSTNDTAQTLVLISNETLPPAEINELSVTYPQFQASPSISRGINIYSPGYASPSIGDQYQTGYLTNEGALTTRLFGTPYLNGIITLTDYSINVKGDPNSQVEGNIKIQSTGLSGIYWEGDYMLLAATSIALLSRQALQHKLNAAETWEIITPTLGANTSLTYHFGYSYKGTSLGVPVIPISLGLFTSSASGSFIIEPVSAGAGGVPFAGFQFTPAQTFNIITLLFQGSGTLAGLTPTNNIYIYTDNAGSPGNILFMSENIAEGLPVPNSFSLPSSVQVFAGQTYWIVWNIQQGSVSPPTFQYVTKAGTGFSSAKATTLAGLTPGANMPGNSNWCWQIVGQS